MEGARRIAVASYRQVLEDGPDVCSSESDSENSDHGENWSFADMYPPDMLDEDGKPKNGGPQRLSAAQVLQLRVAAQCTLGTAKPTTQAEKLLAGCQHPTTQAQKRPLASPNLDDDPSGVPKKKIKRKSPAKRSQGRAGGQ
jgi:hypothetical protein